MAVPNMPNEPTAMDPRNPALNYVIAGGVKSPGRCYFTGLSRPYNWEVKKGYGQEGAATIFRGRDICEFTLTIELFNADDFRQWALFSKVITPPQPVTPLKPFLVQMSHPLLAQASIGAVAVKDAGVPEKTPGADRWLVVIKLIEYRPLKDALAKADKSIPALDKKPPEPPKTAGDRFLEGAKEDIARAELRAAQRGRK